MAHKIASKRELFYIFMRMITKYIIVQSTPSKNLFILCIMRYNLTESFVIIIKLLQNM